MSHSHHKIVHRILNIWCCFVMLLIIVSLLPHWNNIGPVTWIMYACNFWIFLSAAAIALQDTHHRSIFINLSLLFLIDTSSLLNIFIGTHYLTGSDKIAYLFYQYHIIVSCIFYNFNILFILMKLILRKPPRDLYLITGLITGLIAVFLFKPYFTSPMHAFSSTQILVSDLYMRTLQFNILALLCSSTYGLIVLFKDKKPGEYINLIVIYFFITSILDLVHDLSMIYHFRLYGIHLFLLAVSILFISTVLFRKLVYTYSDFGQFYENLLFQKEKGKVKIIPRYQRTYLLLFSVLKMYIIQRRHMFFLLLLLIIGGIFYFEWPAFLSYNLIALTSGGGIIFLFYNSLYKKRKKDNLTL
jgi:hypothetical protein